MLQEYITEASEYVVAQPFSASESKKTQIRLNRILNQALLDDLTAAGAKLVRPIVGEIQVGGGLRRVRVDLLDFGYPETGLNFACEAKPVYRGVIRNAGNRHADIQGVPLNLHLRFPYSVVATLMTLPIWSIEKRRKVDVRDGIDLLGRRLAAQPFRQRADEPNHLAEATALVVYDPDDARVVTSPCNLGWGRFIDNIVAALSRRQLL